MVINDMVGLIADGSTPRAGAPTDARRTLSIPQGTSVTLQLRVYNPAGQLQGLSEVGTTLTMTVKKSVDDPVARITKTASISSGVATFALAPGDTDPLDPGLYYYDVWLVDSRGHNPVVPLSVLRLLPSVGG